MKKLIPVLLLLALLSCKKNECLQCKETFLELKFVTTTRDTIAIEESFIDNCEGIIESFTVTDSIKFINNIQHSWVTVIECEN